MSYKIKEEITMLFPDEAENIKSAEEEIEFLSTVQLMCVEARREIDGKRLQVEALLIDAMKQNTQGPWKDEGTNTYHTQKGPKVSVTCPVSRKVDPDALKKVVSEVAMEDLPINTKFSVDVAALRQFKFVNPEAYEFMQRSRVIIEKPGKPQVKVIGVEPGDK